MTPQEILNEIYRLPLPEQAQIAESVLKNRTENNRFKPKMTEEEFAEYLLAKGIIREIPKGITDEEDDFEPIEFDGEPLSETIIRERR